MSDKRLRVMVDLDSDIEQMIEEERRRAWKENFLELSQAAAAKALLRKLRAMTRTAPPPEARAKAQRRKPEIDGQRDSRGYAGPTPRNSLLEPGLHLLSTWDDEDMEELEKSACDLLEAA